MATLAWHSTAQSQAGFDGTPNLSAARRAIHRISTGFLLHNEFTCLRLIPVEAQ
jgi:hypothetical protein